MSLVEIAIVSGLLLVVSLGMLAVLTGAVNYYHATNATLDAQQGVLFGMNRISQELTEAHRDTVLMGQFPAAGGADSRGWIIFASPRDANGNYQFDTFGRLLWQKFICYYVGEVGPPDDRTPALLRAEQYLEDLGTLPAIVPPSPRSFALTGDTFAALAQSGVMGRHVNELEFKEAREVIEEDPGMEEVFGSRIVQVTMRASAVYRTSFSVETETSVLLRN